MHLLRRGERLKRLNGELPFNNPQPFARSQASAVRTGILLVRIVLRLDNDRFVIGFGQLDRLLAADIQLPHVDVELLPSGSLTPTDDQSAIVPNMRLPLLLLLKPSHCVGQGIEVLLTFLNHAARNAFMFAPMIAGSWIIEP
jgi:hypothetical protein